MKLTFPIPNMVQLKAMSLRPWELKVTGAEQTRLAKWADDVGYDMLSTGEHFVIPKDHVELSGPKYAHAAAMQGYLAGATTRIKVNSSIALVALQHPAVTAKALATIDDISSGRVITTFGAGWLKPEFDALGVPFHERGARMDEYVAAIIELWTKEYATFEGKFVSFKDVTCAPKPFQKPHIPVWFGGDADAALKRVAKWGSGWWPFLTKHQDLAARIDFIKSQPAWKGGPLDVFFGLSASLIGEGHKVQGERKDMSDQEIIDRLGALKRLGVTYTSVPIPAACPSLEAFVDYARHVIEDIRPKLQ
jgi:probable F420-dependent oxidoreductase